jgi:enoyl-CoA hydratase/carnithine racemase
VTFTAREFTGEEAEQLGLATRLDSEPRIAAFELATQIAFNSPAAVRAAKRLLNLPVEANATELLTAESIEQQELLRAGNLQEAIAAFRALNVDST